MGQFDGLSFSKAFAAACKAGMGTFEWKGGEYGTKLRDEVETPIDVLVSNKLGVNDSFNQNKVELLLSRGEIPGFTRIKRRELDKRASSAGKAIYNVVDYYRPNGLIDYAHLYNNNSGTTARKGLLTKLAATNLYNYYRGGNSSNLSGTEVYVTGHLTHIKPNMQGFIPVKASGTVNPVYLNYTTGEYYMTNPKTNLIIRSSSDEKVLTNPNLWTTYHTGLNGDELQAKDSFSNNRGAYEVAEDRRHRENYQSNRNFHNVYNDKGQKIGTNGKISTKQNIAGQNSLKQAVANTVNGYVNYANNAIMGLGRAAINGDYSMKDYWKSMDLRNIGDADASKTYGLGDMVEAENPNVRFLGNMVNTYSVAPAVKGARVKTESRTVTAKGTPFKVRDSDVQAANALLKGKTTKATAPKGTNTTVNKGKSYHMGHGDVSNGKNRTTGKNIHFQNGWQNQNQGPTVDRNMHNFSTDISVNIPEINGVSAGKPRLFPVIDLYNVNPKYGKVTMEAPYAVQYTLGNPDKNWITITLDATKHVKGKAGKDKRLPSNVTVTTSDHGIAQRRLTLGRRTRGLVPKLTNVLKTGKRSLSQIK